MRSIATSMLLILKSLLKRSLTLSTNVLFIYKPQKVCIDHSESDHPEIILSAFAVNVLKPELQLVFVICVCFSHLQNS